MKRSRLGLCFSVVLSLFTIAVACAQTAPKPTKPPRNLAILIFDGVQIIDYTGPYETGDACDGTEEPVHLERKGEPQHNAHKHGSTLVTAVLATRRRRPRLLTLSAIGVS
jgi:hypothetical protein